MDVTIANFNEKFPEITKSLDDAKFIGIDLEFSALYPLKSHTPSLLDSPVERYIKLRKNSAQVIPIQIGLTAFSFNSDKNTYHGTVYNFNIVPASFPTINRPFYFQTDTLNFLKMYDFDFNKFVYGGVPFINRDQEEKLRKKLESNDLNDNEINFTIELDNILGKLEDGIEKWHKATSNNDPFAIQNLMDKYQHNYEIAYFIHRNIRRRYKNVWTEVRDGTLFLKKVTNIEYAALAKAQNLEGNLITNLLGFTNVFRMLTSLRKPIIGHNVLQDILLMIQNFETALPESYDDFKKLANTLFPSIFDTKVITYNMKHSIAEESRWHDSSLEALFEYFKNGTGRHLAMNSPAIEILGESYNYGKFHQAGWDSFCAGYIFVRLAYLKIYKQYPKSKTFVSGELLSGMLEWRNYVNVIRCAVSSIKIDGEDPSSTRPPCLVIESINNDVIDLHQVNSLLRSFGFVELKRIPYFNKRALIAVDNFGNARRILNDFKTHNEYRIKPYNVIKHSPIARIAILSSVTISGTLLLWLTYNAIKK